MNPISPTNLPFELLAAGRGGGFVSFDIGEIIALPLLSLTKATLRGTESAEIVLEFAEYIVVIQGRGLAELFEHILAARVRTVRIGTSGDGCTIEHVNFTTG